MQNFIKTIINAVQAWTKKEIKNNIPTPQQSDWNQNDPNDEGYIKNRPFYEVIDKVVLIEKQTIVTTTQGDYAKASLNYLERIPCDGIVDIIFDGVTYSDIAAYESGGDMCVYANFTTNNGDIISICESVSISMPPSLAGTHTIEVIGKFSTINQIKKDFLPAVEWDDIVDSPGLHLGDNHSITMSYGDSGYGYQSVSLSRGKASGSYSFATGDRVYAVGEKSFASGRGTNPLPNSLTSNMSKEEAFNLRAEKNRLFNLAFGNYSHTEGNNTTAWGEDSHAEGVCSVAFGDHSHAEGWHTIAWGTASHAEGQFNLKNSDGTLAHIVGNGAGINKRSNAHTLDWEGNAWYSGDVYVGSTSGTNKDDGSKKLATEEFVNISIANLIDSAPETLNTLNELATAIQENDNVIDTLNAAITNKITIPQNAVMGDLLTYDGSNWVRISKADLISDILLAIEESNKITFYIEGEEYRADKNMTWHDWCNSNYNTSNFGNYYEDERVSDADDHIIYEDEFVHGSDIIIANYSYTVRFDPTTEV